MSYKKFLVAADNHGSLVSEEAKKKILDFAKSWKPNYKIHLGDFIDLAPLRRGASPEERADGISDDVMMGMEFLKEFKPNYLTLGNHDDRLALHSTGCADGMLRERCAELWRDNEDGFKKLNITTCQYHVSKFLMLPEGGPKFIHGFRATMYPAKSHFENWGPCIHGHVHKPDVYVARHIEGQSSFSVGCLADIDQLSYADRTPAKLAWRNGFLYGLVNEKTGAWQAWNVIKEGNDWISPMGIL
jgi:predicted phosphodiesterase